MAMKYYFHVGATLEMSTTLCKMHLLNDSDTTGLNTEQKDVGREQDSGETEREIDR